MTPIESLSALPPAEFAEALKPLFEAAAPLARALYAERPFDSYAALIDRAEALASELPEPEQIEVVNAHPRIGESAARMSAQSAREQGARMEPGLSGSETERLYADLARLNAEYEQGFGFRFVVFVNKRPRSAIREVLRARMHNPREQELRTALRDMFFIARDRLAALSA